MEITKEIYLKQANSKLIAVDYDDTITLHKPFPEKSKINPKAKKYLDKLHKKGFRIVLWTARVGDTYKEALDRCKNEFGLDYIEEDSPELIHGNTGKLVARYYIDDKSSYGKVNWRKTYKYLIKVFK